MKIYSPLKFIFGQYYRRLTASSNAKQSQERIFNDIIKKGTKTLFGFDHNFSKIKTIEDFYRYVPVNSYKNIFPYIESLMRGNQNTLWSSNIKFLTKSSGTTKGKIKYIPVSPESLKENFQKAERDMVAVFLHNYPDSDLLHGKNLFISGSKKHIDVKLAKINALWGEDLMIYHDKKSAFLGENFFDENEHLKAIFEKLANEQISSIIDKPEILLAFLKVALKEKNAQYIDEIFPDLKVFFHYGSSLNLYKRELNFLSKRRLIFQEIYAAAEGIFALQLEPQDDDMLLLMDHGIFYEFVEHENFLKKDFTNVKTIKDVQLGQAYDMIITTASGLWRYAIEDTIVFTSLEPYKIKIIGKSKVSINTLGVELLINNVEEALNFACQQTDSAFENFLVGPKHCNDHLHGSHEWAIEFSKAPKDLNLFSEILDEKLQSINAEYRNKRHKDIILGAPLVTVLPAGFFVEWKKAHQNEKIPKLCNTRKFLDDIHKHLENDNREEKVC